MNLIKNIIIYGLLNKIVSLNNKINEKEEADKTRIVERKIF